MLGLEVFRIICRTIDPKIDRPCLPCPQAPLQSITAAASLTTPASVPWRVPSSRMSAGAQASDTVRPENRPEGRIAGTAPSAPTGTTCRSRPNAPWTEAEVATGPQGSEPDRPSRHPRPRPRLPASEPPTDRRRQAIDGVGGDPRWPTRHERHAGTTSSSERSQRASDPTLRRKPCRREIVPVGCDSERGEMHATLHLPPGSDRRRSCARSKPRTPRMTESVASDRHASRE